MIRLSPPPNKFTTLTAVALVAMTLTTMQPAMAQASNEENDPFQQATAWIAQLLLGKQLIEAVESNNLPAVQQAIAAGADVNDGHPLPLIVAVRNGHADIVRILIDAGAFVNESGSPGYPIHEAVNRGYADIVRMLLDAGAYASMMDSNGRTPFDLADCAGKTEIAQLIRKAGGLSDPELPRPAGVIYTGDTQLRKRCPTPGNQFNEMQYSNDK